MEKVTQVKVGLTAKTYFHLLQAFHHYLPVT